jgi:serine/threonine-protein kinase
MKKILLITIFCWTSMIRPLQAQLVSTFAGSGSQGSSDGTGTSASFSYPIGIAVDVSGNVYVTDAGNNLIRKITSAGVVSTLAGSGSIGSTDGTGTAASFNDPNGVAVDGSGNVYVADMNNNLIRKITSAGVVSTFAGSVSAGFADGTGIAASFKNPFGIAIDGVGNLYVGDFGNSLIRKITPTGVVSTFAGSGSQGSSDGKGTAARFFLPAGVSVDGSGNVYVADEANNLIRKITPAGLVSILAGSGSQGSADGTGIAASFKNPFGIAVDGSGNVYVADTDNNRIRKISGLPAGIEALIFVSDMKLYPIPAKQNLTLELTLQCDGNLRLELINIAGIKVVGVEGNYNAGLNEITLAVGTLPAGIYVANVYFNGQLKSQKILIER